MNIQLEVYLQAVEIARNDNAKTVYDVGCGSGYKLVHYLGNYDTTGCDVPETLELLRRNYPDRKWAHAPFSDRLHSPADVVIWADATEMITTHGTGAAWLCTISF